MRVAIVCGAGIVSGKEIMVLELIGGLRDKGYVVDVATSSWRSHEFRRRCEKLGAHVHEMRLGFISATLQREQLRMTAHQALYWPGLLVTYARFLQHHQSEKLIHTNWHHLLLLALFLKRERDIFWVHEVIPNKPQYRKFFGWLERRLQCFVAVSYAVAASLREIDINEKNIRVIQNGISDPTGGVLEQSHRDKLIVGIVGQIGAWKGHEDLFEAFAMIAPEFPNAELHVFGKGSADYERDLQQQARALRIANRTIWHGFVANRAEIYQTMNVCVVPTRSPEPFGLIAIEASFFGIPVIATKRGGLPEIVEHGRTGFLVEARRPEQLALNIKRLLADEMLRREMGDNARRKAIGRFQRERFVEDFLQVIEER